MYIDILINRIYIIYMLMFLDNNYDEWIQTPEGLKKYLNKFFKPVFDIFEKDGYFPPTLDDANYYLMQNIFKLDKQQNLLGVYLEDGKQKSITITTDNYFCGYFYKIWENLTFCERLQIVYWHIKNKQHETKTKLNIRFIPDNGLVNYIDIEGCYSNLSDRRLLYININNVLKNNPFDIITTIEHEFEHIKQKMHYNYLKKRHMKLESVYDFMSYWDPDYLELIFQPQHVNFGFYVSHQMEISADNRGIKNLLKIFANCKKHYALDDEQQQQLLKKYILNFKMNKGLLTSDEVDKLNLSQHDKQALKEIYKIRENEEFLNKLCVIKAYHTHHKNYDEVEKCNLVLEDLIKRNIKDEEYVNSVWENMYLRTKQFNHIKGEFYDEEKNEE